MESVAIVRSDYDSASANIARAVDLCGGLDIGGSESIVIKVNLCDFRTPETGAVTHPVFLYAFLKYLREKFGDVKIYVVESDATVARPDLFVEWFGLLPILKKWGAKWVNLSKCRRFVKRIKGSYFQEIEVPEVFEGSFFITLPKMKTSSITKISCALKNQFGCLHYPNKISFHPMIDDVIVDANLAMHPSLCIVDGIIAMGGSQGPTFGIPIHARTIVAGKDPVAVDAVCANIMNFNPRFIKHIQKAAAFGVGSMRYTLVGEEIDEVRTDFRWSTTECLLIEMAQWVRSVQSRGKR